jgi:hypothetical protein
MSDGAAWTWQGCPQRAEGVEVTKVADGYIVYQPDRERVHYLNQTAAVILELCEGTVQAQEIVAFLQGAFDLPEAPTAEVAECLTKLFAEGLLA